MRDFMINELNNLNIHNKSKIPEYVDFCIGNQSAYEKYNTSYHHILPKAKNLPFGKYSDLKSNDWNGVVLSHKNHYMAHYILTQALNEPSILCAFCAMNNKDIRNRRLSESDLIGSDKFHKIVSRRNKELSNLKKSDEWKQTIGIQARDKMLENFNYIEAAEKRKKTINSVEWRTTKGITMWQEIAEKIDYQVAGKKQSVTKNSDEWKQNIGKQSIEKRLLKMDYVETGRKQALTKNSDEWKQTKGVEAKKRLSVSRRKLSSQFNVFNYKNELIYKNLDRVDVREISASLETKTKDNRMGSTRQGKIELNKRRNLHLIGWYVEKLIK